jgi:hypothetical protein
VEKCKVEASLEMINNLIISKIPTDSTAATTPTMKWENPFEYKRKHGREVERRLRSSDQSKNPTFLEAITSE